MQDSCFSVERAASIEGEDIVEGACSVSGADIFIAHDEVLSNMLANLSSSDRGVRFKSMSCGLHGERDFIS